MIDNEWHIGTLKFVGGRLCLDFANTAESLASYADLLTWSQQAGILTESKAHYLREEATHHPTIASAILERAITLWEAIYRIFSAVAGGRSPEATDIATLNDTLSEALSRLRLTLTADGLAWRWAGSGDTLEQVLWPVAQSAAELLTKGELRRVRICDGDDCGWLFYDTSKNRSRRWCSMEDCGNRAKARRHYQRQRAQREARR